jgi:LacI family transcriptional regulator
MAGSRITRVTLKDISLKTGYTINTVSRALKNKDDISTQARELIQKTAKEMGYINNSLASSMRSGSTKTIAIIIGDISNPHFAIMVKEIEKSIRKHGYVSLVINTEENSELEEQAIYSALGKQVDGIIICPVQKSVDNIEYLKRTGIPFVLLGRRFERTDFDYVICDDTNGGYLATKHLLEKEHKRILILKAPDYISSAKERLEGYVKAMNEHQIEVDNDLIQEVGVVSGDSRQVIKRVLDEGIQFTAVVAFNDMMAWEVIYTLNRKGYKVPDNIAVVGFDNIQSRFFFPFPLTTIANSKSKMSKRAVDVLLKKINDPDAHTIFNEIIQTKLIVRDST